MTYELALLIAKCVTQLSILNDENAQLTKKVEELENLQENLKTKSVSESNTQTEALYDEVEFPCKNCIYEADCPDELQWHMKSSHGIGDPYYEFNYSCRVCSKHFDVKNDLMYHIKTKHERNMPVCKYYQNGDCHFTDDKCWFIHRKQDPTLASFKCGYCGKIFSSKNSFKEHRREEHIDQVKICRNFRNNNCNFDEKSWYIRKNETINTSGFSDY